MPRHRIVTKNYGINRPYLRPHIGPHRCRHNRAASAKSGRLPVEAGRIRMTAPSLSALGSDTVGGAAYASSAAKRRSMLKSLAIAGAAVSAATLRPSAGNAAASQPTSGDVAILRLLAAAELIEADLWQQYAELGGVTTGTQNAYQLAFQQLDGDGSQYITSNTLDEQSHAQFLNAYLSLRGQKPVNFDQFRTLPSSQAAGAQQIGRLTNLTQLSVDTSWYTRYRSSTNPDFGVTYPQAIPALASGHFS